jgi:predicted DNA-binding transcriptional regulator YafY
LKSKYIKSLPLHHTQQIISDDLNGLQIRLNIHLTFDVVMELLSFGGKVKVLKPESLINEIKDAHERAFKQYNQA